MPSSSEAISKFINGFELLTADITCQSEPLRSPLAGSLRKAHQLVPGRGQGPLKIAQVAQTLIIAAAGLVDPDQNLVSGKHLALVNIAAVDHTAGGVVAIGKGFTPVWPSAPGR